LTRRRLHALVRRLRSVYHFVPLVCHQVDADAVAWLFV
jgi:hypothetical protein